MLKNVRLSSGLRRWAQSEPGQHNFEEKLSPLPSTTCGDTVRTWRWCDAVVRADLDRGHERFPVYIIISTKQFQRVVTEGGVVRAEAPEGKIMAFFVGPAGSSRPNSARLSLWPMLLRLFKLKSATTLQPRDYPPGARALVSYRPLGPKI